jgi:hypothetical protein
MEGIFTSLIYCSIPTSLQNIKEAIKLVDTYNGGVGVGGEERETKLSSQVFMYMTTCGFINLQ